MTINWYGHSCFKIVSTGGHLTIFIDPFDKKIGLTPPRGTADVVLITHDHYDHNNVSSISGEPFVIDCPGEYDIRGTAINGVDSYHDENTGKDRGSNTIYKIDMDDIKVCHLGDFGQKNLTDNQVEEIGEVDVLMVPVGGTYTIDAKTASKIANALEPRLVIPMHYKLPGLTEKLADVKDFLIAMGSNGLKPVDKLTLKKKDLTGETMSVVLLKN